jgi:hypothetical protein
LIEKAGDVPKLALHLLGLITGFTPYFRVFTTAFYFNIFTAPYEGLFLMVLFEIQYGRS